MDPRVAVVTDSTADLPKYLSEPHGVTAVPLSVTLDGSEYLDGIDITPDEFYARLHGARQPATTSQPAPQRFVDVYRALLKEHESVVSIHISEHLSGTLSAARQAAQEVDERRVRVLDSRLVSMALGLAVMAAALAAQQGAGADEVAATAERVSGATHAYFTVASLEYLRRGGRIGRASAVAGSVLQVKPVLMLEDGQIAPRERVRTYERALSRVAELAAESAGAERLCAFVAHARQEGAAERLGEVLAPRAESLVVLPLGPVVGAHAGPGTVGAACYPASVMPLHLGRLQATPAVPENVP